MVVVNGKEDFCCSGPTVKVPRWTLKRLYAKGPLRPKKQRGGLASLGLVAWPWDGVSGSSNPTDHWNVGLPRSTDPLKDECNARPGSV